MKTVTIISGKGGTGKTSLVGSFAVLARNRAVMVDGDVDAANLSLILKPVIVEEHLFCASEIAEVDHSICNSCNLCRELCRFDALSRDYRVDIISCEGCGFCCNACPVQAIKMRKKVSGEWYVSETPYGSLVHARLGLAEENSGKLVTTVREKALELSKANDKELIIIDGPPGIGCPVIASLTGSDIALVVTEPSISGIHDLKRVITLCNHFKVNVMVCINRYDMETELTSAIEQYCSREKIIMAGKIPFNRAFVDAALKGLPVIEYTGGELPEAISKVWQKVEKQLA